jgi:hypothetical protein
MIVSGCGGGSETGVPSSSGPGGRGASNTSGPGPDYGINGFSVGVNEALANVTVTTQDRDGRPVNYASGAPSDMRIVFDPARGTLSLFSEGRTFNGDVDPESVTMTANGPNNQVFRNLVSGNDATLDVGNYAWRLSARYDQDDGPFRHNLVAAGGQIFLPVPTSGEGRYEAVMQGIIEQRDSVTAAWQQVPYLARGSVTISFKAVSRVVV